LIVEDDGLTPNTITSPTFAVVIASVVEVAAVRVASELAMLPTAVMVGVAASAVPLLRTGRTASTPAPRATDEESAIALLNEIRLDPE
jgi:hypothetical protein